MTAHGHVKGKAVPLARANVDTDAILPKQFMKSLVKTGMGAHLFDEWRHVQAWSAQDCGERELKPDFSLNMVRYAGAPILIAKENFGCGSSREHAVWALEDFGIRAILAPSFGDIFYGNCYKNGVLAISLDHENIDRLLQNAQSIEDYQLEVDLRRQQVISAEGCISFDIDAAIKHRVLNNLSEIGLTLQNEASISEFEQRRRTDFPWLFPLSAGSR